MRTRLPLLAIFGAALACAAAGRADDVTARNPLMPPLFSLDPESPEVTQGPLLPGDLLLRDGPAGPVVEIPAGHLGLLHPDDDVNALGLGVAAVGPTDTFVLIFSVDRATVGGAAPDPDLVALGFPFNVQDQAAKIQASSDSCMSLLLFDRTGPIPPSLRLGSHSPNNTVVINGGDAGGVDYHVSPEGLSPSLVNPDPNNLSGVGAGAGTQPPPPRGPADDDGRDRFAVVLFSLSAGSPSLPILPGTGSAADIYVDFNTAGPGGEELYVAPYQIGLTPGDDIDGVIIFDDGNYVFENGIDQVIFSLSPLSPSLAGTFSPADLFTSVGFGVFAPYCQAESLGLGPADNVDQLDYVMCDDVLTCVDDWAIGFVADPCPWDLDHDGMVGLSDLATLLATYGLCAGDPGYLPAADFVPDDCVNLADLAELLAHYGEQCDP